MCGSGRGYQFYSLLCLLIIPNSSISHNWKDKFKSVPEKAHLGTDQPYPIHHFSTLEMGLKACSAPHGTTRFKEKKTLILLLSFKETKKQSSFHKVTNNLNYYYF